MSVRVVDLAHGRSGDKGDTCNVGLVAYDADGYEMLRRHLTRRAREGALRPRS